MILKVNLVDIEMCNGWRVRMTDGCLSQERTALGNKRKSSLHGGKDPERVG